MDNPLTRYIFSRQNLSHSNLRRPSHDPWHAVTPISFVKDLEKNFSHIYIYIYINYSELWHV
jgi:hypothetical protein